MSTEIKVSAGDLLKQGRLRQRLSVAECAKRTHIAPRFIEALEEERWDALPSESHRLGFLRLYARFLGVSADEVLAIYQQKSATPQATTDRDRVTSPHVAQKPITHSSKTDASQHRSIKSASSEWSPRSIPQLLGIGFLLLAVAWGIYHAVSPHLFEQNQMPWVRRRAATSARLAVPTKSTTRTDKIRIESREDCWLRVTTNNQLIYEGILPSGAKKEWSSAYPFDLKIGNVKAVSVFWNDQTFDINPAPATNKFRIPPQ